MQIQTLYNPHYQTTEGLISPWIKRGEMNEYVVVINRDYLFEVDVLERARGMRDEKICVTVRRRSAKARFNLSKINRKSQGERILRCVGTNL